QASTPTGIGTYTDAFALTLTDESGNTVAFSDGTATVSVPCDEDDGIQFAYCIANGARTERQPVTVSGGMASWSTTHFSTWALSANEYEISGSNPGTGDEFFLTDGNYYVDIDLWKASANEESMGNVGFANNDRALVTVENGEITTVQVATNPVDVDEYHSAIITFRVIGSTVSVQETGSVTTQPAGKTYDYIESISFAMPDDGQPDIAGAITYIDVQFCVPDTPMDAVMGGTLEARLRFKWSSAEATSDTTLKSDDSTAKGTSSITGTTIADIKLTDADTGIILTTDTDHVDDSGKFSVAKITSGNDYETTVKAMSSITKPWLLYKIVVNVDGVETAPKGSVTLSFPCEKEGLTIYRISDSGVKTALKGKIEKGYYVLDTSTLGLFAVEGELSTVTIKEDLKDTATGIQLTSLKDVLPDGAVLKVTAMNDGTGYTAAQTALKGKAEQFKLYAISTQTSAGAATAPTDEVSLYFPVPDGYTSSLVEVYQITDDGKATRIGGSVKDGHYVISTSDLGTFALVQRSASVLDQFTDIPETHWARSYIETAVKSGLFSGTSKTEFNPEGEMSRAMMFTVFFNLSGDKTEGTGEFWYSTAMDWAKEKGISDGNNPNGSITREQLVTMLYRYTGSKQASGDLSSYEDANMVSEYAVEAMKWAVSQGIVAGTTDGHLNPDQTAKRAEVATILVRYMEKK
ncbi:MAG: S-layer homology domain-containing protein, partial [Anaerotignum sp.]|nr:S-layer homology domain-containing protein [Anaerotignum sp.]